MKKYNVAILGATGAVGMEMLKVLQERDFPIQELRLLASSRSAGKVVETEKYGSVTIQEAKDSAFEGMDIVLGAAENDISKRFVDAIKASGAAYIDNSSAFRMDPEVPLVVPEINPEDAFTHKGVIANPNCSTIITLVAINAINHLSPIEALYASTYQAVSGAGIKGPKEMYEQSRNILEGKDIECSTFPYQIAYNLLPQIGGFGENGYTSEEMKLQNEGRKIMHLPELRVNCTCVRVPVLRSHSESITLEFERDIPLEQAREILASAPGVKLVDDRDAANAHDRFPMPIDTSDQDLIWVGRMRRDISNPNESRGITFWCCGDQIRKGAATNAVQIAQLLVK